MLRIIPILILQFMLVSISAGQISPKNVPNLMGTWALDTAKSKSPDFVKSHKLVITQNELSITITSEMVVGKDSTVKTQTDTFRFDGAKSKGSSSTRAVYLKGTEYGKAGFYVEGMIREKLIVGLDVYDVDKDGKSLVLKHTTPTAPDGVKYPLGESYVWYFVKVQ